MDYHNRFSTLCGRIVGLALLLVTCAHHLNALDLTALSSQLPIKPNTLSFAYLKNSELGARAETQYETTPEQDALIEQILQKEAELANAGYLVVYHAHSGPLYVLHELYKQLYCQIYHCARPLRFEFLRSPLQKLSDQSAKSFLEQHKDYINDNYEPYKSQLLSVNVALFGNTWKWGESSLKLFLQNRSISPPLIANNVLENLYILRTRSFDEECTIIDCIKHLCEKIQEHSGLIQIAIPRHLVSQVCYLCSIRGVPNSFYKNSKMFIPWDNPKSYLENLLTYFDLLAQEPKEKDSKSYYAYFSQTIGHIEEIDHVQMRVLMQPSGMGNPKSGITMFRYTTLTKEDQKYIQQELLKLL